MAKFMDVHSGFFGVTSEQLNEAHGRDIAIEAEEGVHFERAWLDPEAGKVFRLATGRPASRSCGSTSGRAPDRRGLRAHGGGFVMRRRFVILVAPRPH